MSYIFVNVTFFILLDNIVKAWVLLGINFWMENDKTHNYIYSHPFFVKFSLRGTGNKFETRLELMFTKTIFFDHISVCHGVFKNNK